MAMRSRTTFKKRQKELARVEKQRDKSEQRALRKQQKSEPSKSEAPSCGAGACPACPAAEGKS